MRPWPSARRLPWMWYQSPSSNDRFVEMYTWRNTTRMTSPTATIPASIVRKRARGRVESSARAVDARFRGSDTTADLVRTGGLEPGGDHGLDDVRSRFRVGALER